MEKIIQNLKSAGLRKTKLRDALLEVFERSQGPINVPFVIKQLKKYDINPSPSTLYRQLETLVKIHVIEAVLLDSKIQMFELKKDHHHHFVCGSCDEVSDLKDSNLESEIIKTENNLRKKGLFTQKHEITFFGQCAACSENIKK